MTYANYLSPRSRRGEFRDVTYTIHEERVAVRAISIVIGVTPVRD